MISAKANILWGQKQGMNQCYRRHPEDDINVWLHSLSLKTTTWPRGGGGGKKTSWSAGGCLSAWSKAMNTHITVGPGNCSSTHYSALPQRSGGGWDEAEPHTGHRGWNKSQMFWGDVKIHGHASLSGFYSILACSHVPTGTHREGWGIWRMSVLKWKKNFFFFFFSFLSVVCNHSSRL